MGNLMKNKLLVLASLVLTLLAFSDLKAATSGVLERVQSSGSVGVLQTDKILCPDGEQFEALNVAQDFQFQALMAGSGNCGGGGGPTNLSVNLTPEDPTRLVGESVTWNAAASGGTPPYTYELRFGSNLLHSETTSGAMTAYSISNLQELSHEGQYSVTVTDSAAANAGDSEILAINPVILPPASVSLAASRPSPVNQGLNLIFTATASGGSAATGFRFYRGASLLQDSASNTYTIPAINPAHAGNYTAVAYNIAGSSPVSNSLPIAVTSAPTSPSLNISPSPSVVEGTPTSLVASITSGTGPFTYTFFKGATQIASYVSSSLSQVHNLGAATAAMAGDYSVTISNSAGSVNASNSLQVIPSTGLYIDVTTPEHMQVGVSLQPTYRWKLYDGGVEVPASGTPANSIFRIKVSTEANCPTATNPETTIIFERNRLSRDVFTSAVTLNPQTTYYVCARLEDATTGTVLADYDINQFNTRLLSIPLVSLHTNPSSSETQASGHVNFEVIAEAPESGSLVYLYSYDAQGLLIGQFGSAVALDSNGQAVFHASVTHPEQIEVLRFKARIQRPGETGPLPASTTNYYYDPAAGLTPPVIEFSSSTCDGNIQWQATAANHTYKVYSRKNKDQLPLPLVGEFFNFNQAPYKLIAEVPALGALGLVNFNDPNFNNPIIGAEGISYFVTASDGSRFSRRSNAINCRDTTNNDLANHSIQILEGEDGRTLSFYLIENLTMIPHAQADNDPERYAYVQLTPTTSNCSGITWDNTKDTTLFHFDALTRITDPARALSQAVPIGSATFETGTAYCAVVCMTDSSTTRTALQSRSEDFADHPELCMEPRRVTLNPNFDGITQLIPQDDGESMKVKWQALETNPQEVEFVDYRVEAVKVSSPSETPDFGGSLDASIVVGDITARETMLSGLETGAYYAVRVVAVATQLAEGSNQFGGEVHITDRTIDLHPRIRNAKLSFPLGTMTEAVLTMEVMQLQPSQPISGLGREPLKVRFAGFSAGDGRARVVKLNNIERAVIAGSELVSGITLPGETSTISVRLDTSEVLQMLDKDGFTFKVAVENSMGLSGDFTGTSRPEDGLSAGAESGGGCTKSMDGRDTPTPWMLIITLGLLSLMGLRRRLQLQRN